MPRTWLLTFLRRSKSAGVLGTTATEYIVQVILCNNIVAAELKCQNQGDPLAPVESLCGIQYTCKNPVKDWMYKIKLQHLNKKKKKCCCNAQWNILHSFPLMSRELWG